MYEEHKYIPYVEDTKKHLQNEKFISDYQKWVVCENSFKQLLATHPVVLTEDGAD